MDAIKSKIEAGIGQAGYKIPDVEPDEIRTYKDAAYSLNLERLRENFFNDYIEIRSQDQVDPIHRRYRLKVISTSLALGLSFAIYRFTLPYFTKKWEECVAIAREISQSYWTYDYVTDGMQFQGTVHYNGKTTWCGGWFTVSPDNPTCIWSGNYYRTLSYLRWGAIGTLPIAAMAKTPEVPSRDLLEISVNSAALENEKIDNTYICPLSGKPLINPNRCFFIGNAAFDALSCINLWLNQKDFVRPQAPPINTDDILSFSELDVLNRQSEKIFELNLLHDFHAALSISLLQLAERYSLEPHTVSEQDSVIIQAIIRCDYQQFIKSCIQKFNLKQHYQLNADLYNLSNDQVKVKTYEEVYAILDQKIRNVRLFVDIDGVELHVRPTILVFHHLFRQLQNPKEFKKFLNAKLHMTYFEAKAECMYRNNPDFQRELLKISIKQEYNVDLFAFNSELEVLD